MITERQSGGYYQSLSSFVIAIASEAIHTSGDIFRCFLDCFAALAMMNNWDTASQQPLTACQHFGRGYLPGAAGIPPALDDS
ncbi:MAG: hypothetical protein P4L82_04285 [Ancalomicrobiaceae bacterium]|nr:hypothetical protein [Ancalomicrobiaceae bacterium]